MGAACCCCSDVVAAPPPASTRTGGPASVVDRTRYRRVDTTNDACDVCGRVVDPCLLDGHREACRAHHRRVMAQAAQRSTQAIEHTIGNPDGMLQSSDESPPPGMECIICMTQVKSYAFLPCGHVVGCITCVKTLDCCPVCRTRRTGLLHIDLKQDALCVCKHCGHTITPTYYDAHRETCRMQLRAAAEQQRASPTNGDESANPVSQPAVPAVPLCVACKAKQRSVALLPCAHRVLCGDCAVAVHECPICLTRVTERVATYDC